LSIPVVLSGKHARAALADASTWRVLADFRRSVYCQATHGAVVCVGSLSLGAGPLNILARIPPEWSWQDFGVARDTQVEWNDGVLRFGRRLAFSFAQERLWQPDASVLDWVPVVLSSSLGVLTAECRRRAPVDGLAPTIPWLLGGGSWETSVAGLDQALVEAAAPGIAALKAWLGSVVGGGHAHDAPPQPVEKLIGLGPGLTPSGDDFLGGALITLRALGWPDVADTMGRWLLRRAGTRTHAISYAHLRCAVDGAGAAVLHDTLAALVSPGAPGLGARLDALAAFGHSSGWDALAGMAVVASLAATSEPLERSGHCPAPPRCGQ
jgi:Protein of unknown function (DUF2877)